MELLTREDVRRMSDNGTRGPVVVNQDQKLTPGARDWLAAHKIQAVFPVGGDAHIAATACCFPGAACLMQIYKGTHGESRAAMCFRTVFEHF